MADDSLVARRELHAALDAGNDHHLVTVVDASRSTAWRRRMTLRERDFGRIQQNPGLAERVHWAADVHGTASALLLTPLAALGKRVVYVPGRTVNRMAEGAAKTDARDAYVIAERAAIRLEISQ